MRSLGWFFIFALLAGPVARGQTSLKVEVGWEGAFAVGGWTPLFLTLSDDSPRSVVVDVTFPHGGNRQMRLRQPMTIGPTPATFVVYALPGYSFGEGLRIDVRDARSGRLVAGHPDRDREPMPLQSVSPIERLIGTSGRRGLAAPAIPSPPTVGHLPPARLPTAAMAYDGLASLVLNAPDLNALTPAQQQAIADWVRGGGTLLFWADENALPDASPLLDVLPATLGPATLIELDEPTRARLNLPDRFARLRGRVLTPREEAVPLDLLGVEAARGYVRRVGFGTAVVLPFDLALLRLPEPVMQPLWAQLVPIRDDANPYAATTSQAALSAMEQIGQIPGTGRFQVGSVALVLAGLMLVVGPIDWFVLKRLNRQPWTWATTIGWIGLVTAGAIYAGSLLNTGDLHLRTLRTIAEIDGLQVRRADFVGIYAPTTAVYDLQVDPTLWWQPPPDSQGSGRQGLVEDYEFRQTPDGTFPRPMLLRVWNLRFFLGQAITHEPGVIEAKLRRVGDRIEGTITNRGDRELQLMGLGFRRPPAPGEPPPSSDPVFVDGVWRRPSPGGWAQLNFSTRLKPGESLSVAATLPGHSIFRGQTALQLTGLDERKTEPLLRKGQYAVVSASVWDPPAVASIAGRDAKAEHRVQVQAFVPLETQEPTP